MANDESNKVTVNFDEIITKHFSWATAEAGSASDAGTRREAIGSYVEKCGFNSKAFSQFRAGMKLKTPEKRRDWLRSWEHLLEVARREVLKNESEMDLGADDAVDDEGDIEVDTPDTDVETLIKDGDPDLADEAAEFEAQADQVVTPIDFGGNRA